MGVCAGIISVPAVGKPWSIASGSRFVTQDRRILFSVFIFTYFFQSEPSLIPLLSASPRVLLMLSALLLVPMVSLRMTLR